MPTRQTFPDISSRAWEHPADRAALEALRRVPGFDLVVRKVMGLLSERPVRVIAQGSAVEVGQDQLPRVDRIYTEVLETLDAPRRYALFVSENPFLQAGAVGMDDPFIVLSSTAVALKDEELRFVLAHEVAHILSGHSLYKTVLRLLLRATSLAAQVPLAGLPLLAVTGALLEWDRKSELSADRAALLAVQDPEVAQRLLMRLAGGNVDADLGTFREQARRYEEEGSALDSVLKVLTLISRSHPFPVLRLRELDRYIETGAYRRVLEGDYPRRSQDGEEAAWEAWREGAQSYAEGVRSSTEPVARWVREAGEGVARGAGAAWGWVRGRKEEGGDEG